MEFKVELEQAKGNPADLERLYRQALSKGESEIFCETIARWVKEEPENPLFNVWAYRLGIHAIAVKEVVKEEISKKGEIQNWWLAISVSVLSGLLFTLFAGGNQPFPAPGKSNPLFWIGWSPTAALGMLFYLGATETVKDRLRWYLVSAGTIILTTLFVGAIGWNRTDDIANLLALHLPLLSWIFVGFSVVIGRTKIPGQIFGYLLKSMEIIIGSTIYLIAGMIFMALTSGIFSVLGIGVSDYILQYLMSWLIGVVPVLSLATIYDTSRSPLEQNQVTGFAPLLKTLARLLLPIATVVLLSYVCWFIPTNFWKPFTQLEAHLRQREVLIIYNATIIAIIAILLRAVPDLGEKISEKLNLILRAVVTLAGLLTLLLNTYSLAVITSRIFNFGLTPNRHAVLGWNLVTFSILSWILIKIYKVKPEKWVEALRESTYWAIIPIISWVIWVLLVLPFFYRY